MGLRWEQFGESWRGWDDLGRLAADVVRYDDAQVGEPGPDGLARWEVTRHWWAAFLAGERVPGEWDTAEEAQAAADAAHDAEPPPAEAGGGDVRPG